MPDSRATGLAFGGIRFNWRGNLLVREDPPCYGMRQRVNPEVAALEAREMVLRWMLGAHTDALEPGHLRGEDLRVERDGLIVEAGAVPDPDTVWHSSVLWGARQTRISASNPEAAERVEVAIDVPRFVYYITERPPEIAVRCTHTWDSYLWPPRNGWAPTELMRALSAKPGILERGIPTEPVVPILDRPVEIASREDVDALFALLLRADRLPIVVVTKAEARRPGAPPPDYLLDVTSLARRACGLAHIVLMPPETTRRWTELVGRELAVFWGAVALYNPILAPITDEEPHRHRRWLAQQVLEFMFGPESGPAAFEGYLIDLFCERAARRRVVGFPIFFYDYIESCRFNLRQRRAVPAALRAPTVEDSEELTRRVAALQLELDGTRAERDEWRQLAEGSDAEAEQARSDYLLVADQLSRGERRTRDASGRPQTAEADIPTGLSELRAWAEKWFPHKLVLLPRAIRAAEDSHCDLVQLVYQCLILLGTDYRDARLSEPGAHARFQARLKELGVEDEPAISDTGAGQEGDAYFVLWPPGTKQKRKLERHLKRGNDKSGKRLLRIYYFWDDRMRRVVIGWLPGHLPTRQT